MSDKSNPAFPKEHGGSPWIMTGKIWQGRLESAADYWLARTIGGKP